MIYELVKPDHPLLRTKLENFDFSDPPTDPIQLAKDLTETMLKNNGLGLSANQCGLPYRVFVLANNPVIAAFNPRVIDETTQTEIYMDEGCLSFPYLFLKVKRPRIVKVRYTMPNGETTTEKFDGMTARAFLHELDHLNGVVFTDRAHPIHLARGRKAQTKFLRHKKNEARV